MRSVAVGAIGTAVLRPCRTRRSAPPRLAAVLLAAAAALMGTPYGPVVPPAAAEPQDGCHNEVNGQTCGAGAGRPGVVVDLSGEVAPHVSGGGGQRCINGREGNWVDYGPPFPADFDPGSPPEEDARYWVFVCPNANGGVGNEVNWEGAGWGLAPPESPPEPADVLPPLWEAVQARLHNPQIAVSPPVGSRSIVNVPTFVEIVNPQIATRYTATAANSAGSVTVWIDVWPTAALHPGEPDAPAVPCDEDGTAFDPADSASPEAQAQAAGGSCIHSYSHRSPAGWPGDVTIDWRVEWASDQAGQAGTLDAAPSTTPFNRIVDEVNTVVVDYD